MVRHYWDALKGALRLRDRSKAADEPAHFTLLTRAERP